MHYYLALTSKCNLLCKYCYGKSCEDYLTSQEEIKYDFKLPPETTFKIEQLKQYAKHDNNFILTFYGGEPLLQIDKIKEIIDKKIAKKYMMQTNATLLHLLPKEYTNKLSTILTSIDGTKKHTDERRGEGVYDKVIKNIKLIKQNGFKGEIIARMTVDETCDIYESVTHLYNNKDHSFSSIHWQIDAQFWKSDYKQRNFKQWANEQYNPKIKQLINWWIEQIKQTNKVPLIYPFIGIIHSIITKEKSPMKCGAGHSLLGIQTNGKVVACPITAGYTPFIMGDIKTSDLKQVEQNIMLPNNTCTTCEIKDICGGRCLYANKTKLWGEKGFNEVCDTIFFLVNELKSQLPIIEDMIKQKKITKEDFNYPKYNGAEIIP